MGTDKLEELTRRVLALELRCRDLEKAVDLLGLKDRLDQAMLRIAALEAEHDVKDAA